jgi:adenylosuccinate synthase
VCLNGIPPQNIRKIIGTMKAYETYSGFKTHFMDDTDKDLKRLQVAGNEFGATTGRARKTRWLGLDEVIRAIRVNGVTDVIINKVDVLEQVNVFKVFSNGQLYTLSDINEFKFFVEARAKTFHVNNIIWSSTPNGI